MNIFVLDSDPIIAAKMACDQHVVKMVTESAQMLSTAHRVMGDKEYDNILFKATHVNHPCNKWVRNNYWNYLWLWKHYNALGQEYTRRYNKSHKSYSNSLRNVLYMFPLMEEESLITPLFPPSSISSPPPLCMPDHIAEPYKKNHTWESTVQAYRQFYIQEKSKFARWKHSEPPVWYTEGLKCLTSC